MVKKKKNRDNTRTISNYFKGNKTQHKILKFMCHESKNVYNKFLYCARIFYDFKSIIYQEILDKNIEGKNNLSNYVKNRLIEIYNYKSKYQNEIIHNNQIIYKYIIDNYKNKILNNVNEIYIEICNDVKNNLTDIFVEDKWNFMFVDSIVYKIVFSIYRNKYYKLDRFIKYKKLKLFTPLCFNVEFNNHVLNEEIIPKKYTSIMEIKNKINKKVNRKFKNILDEDEKKELIKNELDEQMITGEQTLLHGFAYELIKEITTLPADIRSQIIHKGYANITSHFQKLSLGMKSNFPSYLDKDNGTFVLPFSNSCRRYDILNDNIKLILGYHVEENFISIVDDTNFINQCNKKSKMTYYNKADKSTEKNYHTPYYLNIKIPPIINYKDINYIEIVPLYDGYKFKINIVYEKQPPTILTETKTKKTSVDLGMKNIISSYDTEGNAELYKGNKIITINELASKKIGYWQRKLTETKDDYYKEKIQNIIYDTRIKRTNKLNDEFNLIAKKFMEQNNSCSKIVFGYNRSWKQGSNMTTDNNRKFQHIPYMKLLYKIRLKLKEQKIESITKNESYTSKCDALAYEEVKFQHEYKGIRFTRSLFKSQHKTENEKIIHSDINGAINIMRKEYPDMIINKTKIFNPVNLAWR